MDYRVILINQLKLLPYFSKKDILALSRQFGIKAETVATYVSRSLARKDIISLRNGMYVTTDFYNRHAGDISYTFYLANVLRSPSYVSSWSALQYYNLATEAIGTVTSVTTKHTSAHNNKAGSFAYQSIKKDLFSSFTAVNGKFNFFIASPAKALFDLVYLKTNHFRWINFKTVVGLVEDLRVDIDEMEIKERDSFYALVKKYLK
ncbi:MAG: hypothetical protein Q7K39_01700 [Candidatus Magasanikbacteria bacterium]|nr:hypothetical protein [Candidatus Magasanikbacteria bacterium]